LNKGHKAKYTFKDIIGESDTIHRAVEIAAKMAKTDSSVLITGESGTGKELFAHAVHNASGRRDYPFIAINCAAMPDDLLESELFGYEDGAFTGAKKGGKLGLFEFAHRGSIFLDEVEGMSPALQVKLLRVIQEREVMRVGGNKVISIDVRIIAATNEYLEELVTTGSFRSDLYYRLNTLPVQLPALREREGDIMLLFEHFRKELGGSFILDPEVRQTLLNHPWVGNIRELRNYVEYLTYMDKPVITRDDLPPGFYRKTRGQQKTGKMAAADDLDYRAFLRMIGQRNREYLFVLETLYQGQQSHTTVGRDSILARAGEQNLPLSQREVRDILANLETMGFAKISKGRGGSKITAQGLAILERQE
jgi:transcriptional regulator with PAS, ATPase and Fis domain